MKKLQMTFLNGLGRKHRWTPKAAKQEMTGDEVKTLMQEIVDIGMFQKNGVAHCTGISSAKYVETIETMLFDVEKETQAN